MADEKKRAAKRGSGTGSAPKRVVREGRSPYWVASLMVGYKPDGRPDMRYGVGKTQKECQQKLDVIRGQKAAGTLTDAARGRESVAEFLQAWLSSIESTMEARSHKRHRDNVRCHLVPLIGRHKISDLRPEHVVAMLGALRKDRPAPRIEPATKPSKHAVKNRPAIARALSPRSVRYVFITLRLALAAALRWGAVSRNVAALVDAPKVPRVEIRAMLPEEVIMFLDVVKDAGDRNAPLYEVAVLSGCRLGELLALRWADLSLESGRIAINRTLDGIEDAAPRFGDPKTVRSRRSFMLSTDAVAALKVQRDRQAFEQQQHGKPFEYDLVFTTPSGTPIDPSNALKRFRVALKAAGIETPFTFHSLRHSAATTMMAAGISPRVVSDRLGHSTPAFTLERYSHAVPALDEDAATRMQDALRAARQQATDAGSGAHSGADTENAPTGTDQ